MVVASVGPLIRREPTHLASDRSAYFLCCLKLMMGTGWHCSLSNLPLSTQRVTPIRSRLLPSGSAAPQRALSACTLKEFHIHKGATCMGVGYTHDDVARDRHEEESDQV